MPEELLVIQEGAYQDAMRGSPHVDYEAETQAATIASVTAVKNAILDDLIAEAESKRAQAARIRDFTDAAHWGQVADWLQAVREEGA